MQGSGEQTIERDNMGTDLMNFGIGGAVVIMVIKEVFSFLRSQKDGVDIKVLIVNNTEAMKNLTMATTMIQERLRYHEDNAKIRHDSMVATLSGMSNSCCDAHKEIRSMIRK